MHTMAGPPPRLWTASLPLSDKQPRIYLLLLVVVCVLELCHRYLMMAYVNYVAAYINTKLVQGVYNLLNCRNDHAYILGS